MPCYEWIYLWNIQNPITTRFVLRTFKEVVTITVLDTKRSSQNKKNTFCERTKYVIDVQIVSCGCTWANTGLNNIFFLHHLFQGYLLLGCKVLYQYYVENKTENRIELTRLLFPSVRCLLIFFSFGLSVCHFHPSIHSFFTHSLSHAHTVAHFWCLCPSAVF